MRVFGSSRDPDARRPDLCVIGAGPAGVAAALAGAALGARVVVIEKGACGGERVGFDAPFAVWRHAARHAAEGGLGALADWSEIAGRARNVARQAAASVSAERLRAAEVEVINAHARFVSPDQLVADGAPIAARRFVVATGRALVQPSAPGLELLHALDPLAALTLERRPAQIVILGAGATGLALAQTFARLGAPTIVIDKGAALADAPGEFSEPILRRLAAEGVRVAQHADITNVDPIGAGPGARLRFADGGEIEASHLIYASGWRAATEGLGLETTGARAGADGVQTRGDLRTSARRIFAAGSAVAGAAPDAEMAARMGRLAARGALLGLGGEAGLRHAPEIWPLDPAYARVGLDEARARAAGAKGVRVLRAAFADDDEPRAAGRADGHVALVVDRRGRLLGATFVGRDVDAATMAMSMALAGGLDVAGLAEVPLPGCGGLAAAGRALSVELARRARQPGVARLMGWRRRWG